MSSSPLRVAVVCMSNMNRSMEAHGILRKNGFRVRSFGTGSRVRLPGSAPNLPVVYDFSTTYKQMYNDLLRKDRQRYTKNGILHILGRNERIKPRPERFQECSDAFDVIFTCGESVYDRVVEDLCAREQETFQPVHVINVDIQDTLEDATLGALLICELCQCLQQADDMEDSLDKLLLAVEEKRGKSFLHTVCFY
ncbi:RNA polymerase II subunit A C-terminal domain phosphatase SSU72 like protein 3-like [Diceros bicornis minor]|uniref:RNA polymerase II subunit A C-terminal domain phosphatase SSU72 like protein 3-like n=1 Tax=Diceros bicornis minor TaxID=77932 RepID=UPI0026EBEB10|nr:RNA polymerase II subunit A C-terminal domain phosphatase SSU72 like protein 3-like [Diceros bicornis minor]XP_058400523.1 RNA polymerase II subunit A C-terminal domain phosphatase SSU72 like protein 3-like [Diceros bicornis minor]XP_058400524.1 RNA polymerase II subunit A C-terminal domain phosphatase SSU72 like protein 3-like [Diceros bicornis minor]XP_058400525.1 RNA polymerase II subunit A C-terminal domain phosphatase SSU72 like protein 3-like [Diceros bicornis minor]XP_058400526.1 RNA 